MSRPNELTVLDDTYVSTLQAARLLGTSQTAIRKLIADGELGILKLPHSCVKIRKSDISALAKRSMSPARVGA